MRTKQTREESCHKTVEPSPGPNGEAATDVQTELYRARKAADRERMSLDVIVEQMAEGLLIWDDGMRVVRANRQAQLIFGFTFEEMRDDADSSLAVGRFTDEADQPIPVSDLPGNIAMREHRVADLRLWYTKPDGSRVHLWLTASPIFNEQKALAGAILVARDMTERYRESDRAQQAEKLRALGQLASGVAHNFNNALAAVIGYTQLALPKVKDTPVEKYLTVVEQSAKDAARMVERIQNFSRASHGKDDFMRMRLSDIVRDAIDITRPRWRDDAEAAGIKYEVRLDWNTEEELLINGEPSDLREVFVNIILNALDAMIVGGSIIIHASADETTVRVSLTDSGTGMTEETISRIFDPFYTTKGTSGLGMGLSESYRTIERHGGRIEVDSQPSRGTTFVIFLPRVSSEQTLAANQLHSMAVPISRILIVDDEEPVRRVLAAILGQKGHTVSTADSAAEALMMVDKQDFDVVFTDLAMPKTDGVTTAAEIKSRKPATKVVLMSGYGAERAYEQAGETSGVDFALSKPFRMQDINEALRMLLHH
jgi:PAS domain S-box-containing protein